MLQLAAPLTRAGSVDAVAESLGRSALDMLGASLVAVIVEPDVAGGTTGTRYIASSSIEAARAADVMSRIEDTVWGRELVGAGRATGVTIDQLDDEGAALIGALGAIELDVHPLAVPDQHLGCLVVAWGAQGRRDGAEAALRARALRDFGTLALRNATLLARLHRRELRDGLTGLANRRLLVDRLDRAIASAHRHHRHLAVLVVELVTPAALTDHETDHVLTTVAQRLTGALREEDTVARIDTVRFAILLPEIDDPGVALDVGDKVRDIVAIPVENGGGSPFEAATGVGVAVHPHDGVEGHDLLAHGEIALCRARALGRGHVVRYEPALLAERERTTTLERELREAIVATSIGGRELVVEYQPQVDLVDGRISGLEALVRWNHPARGRLVPGEFLSTAEDSGLVVALDTWVLIRVCRDLEAWRRGGLAVPTVGVNVSVRDLRDPDFLGTLADVLARTAIPAHALELEIADGLPLDDDGVAANALEQVRALGVRLAVDDFGSRRSELAQLSVAPIDTVKIDRRFVEEILTSDGPGLLVDGLVALSGALGKRSVACGVENDDQRAHLARLGCDAVQGWLFAEPIDASLTERLLSRAPVRTTGTK
jgi:diguanylate cyclase (GGDEF)-like protein